MGRAFILGRAFYFRESDVKTVIHWRTSKHQHIGLYFSGLVFSPKKNLGFLPLNSMLEFCTRLKREMKLKSSFSQGSSHLHPRIIYVCVCDPWYDKNFSLQDRLCDTLKIFLLLAHHVHSCCQVLYENMSDMAVVYPVAIPNPSSLAYLLPSSLGKKGRCVCFQTS